MLISQLGFEALTIVIKPCSLSANPHLMTQNRLQDETLNPQNLAHIARDKSKPHHLVIELSMKHEVQRSLSAAVNASVSGTLACGLVCPNCIATINIT